MTDWLNITTKQAIQSLGQNLVVYGVGTHDGEWGQVLAIEELLEHGVRTAAYRIRFASGDVRFGPAGGGFRVERAGLSVARPARPRPESGTTAPGAARTR